MKKYFTILLATIGSISISHSQVFTLVDSIQYTQAQIWGVVSDKGDSINTTTIYTPASKPHIYLRKGDYTDIHQQGTPIQLTFDADFASITNLTDHKSITLNNELYVTFSTVGDADLFIFKTDLNGNRIGSIVPVIQGSSDPTNDMILVTDSTYIYVLHFDPPNQHHVYKFDTNLNPVGSSFSTTTLNHNNIGNVLFHNNQFCMLTGSGFGFSSNLIGTKWDTAWAPAQASPLTIVSSSGGDGDWFPTGMIWDELNQRWYVGMSHINSTDVINQEHIDLLAFDASFNLLQRMHITGQSSYRPHFVLKNNFLYVSYDKSGGGVYLLKYAVANTAGIEENSSTQDLLVYPNPIEDIVNVYSATGNEIVLTDVTGKFLKKFQIKESDQNLKIDMREFASGIYFIYSGRQIMKLIKP